MTVQTVVRLLGFGVAFALDLLGLLLDLDLLAAVALARLVDFRGRRFGQAQSPGAHYNDVCLSLRLRMKITSNARFLLLLILSSGLVPAAEAARRRAVVPPVLPPCAAPHGGAAEVMNSWVVDADQTIENRTITLNGTLEIRRGTLTLRNVALEINAKTNSPSVSRSVVAIDIAPGAGLALSGVRIAATSMAAGVLQADRAAAVTAENTCFSHMAASISSTGRVIFRNNELTLAGTDGVSALTITNSSAALVEGNTIRFALDLQTGSVPHGAGGIGFFFVHASAILRNTIVGAVNGISLWGSWNNRVAENTWNGPTALTAVRANTPNWWSMSTPAGSGEAGISLSWWSNNNIIEKNTLMGAHSAVLFVLQSTNDTISRNVITGAGYGVTLRWASHILVDGNEIRDVYSDAVHAYRSHDVAVTNNRIFTSGSGVSFYACADNTVKSNLLVDSDRGIFLHSSSHVTIDGNVVSGAVQGIFVASSTDNILTNNAIAADSAGWDDGNNNSWAGNYWPAGAPSIIPPGAAADTAPATAAPPYIPAPVTPLTPFPFKEPLNSVTTIRNVQVWRGAQTVSGSIEIESGGSLTLTGATLTYVVNEPTASIWIQVKPGGSLTIEDTKIIGPEWDHTLSIKLYKGAKFSMKRSELRNAGSWVGTFAAAIANEADDIAIEDSTFIGTYCALSGESRPANVHFVNNTITDSVKAIELIGPHPGAVVTGNRISHAAMSGIGVWPFAGFATSSVTDNAFADSWGPAIVNYYNAGSFEIARNTFANVKGPAELTREVNAETEGRQVHVVSTSPSAAREGDALEAVVTLGNVFIGVFTGPQPGSEPRVFVLTLTLNAKAVRTQSVALNPGQFERVRLNVLAGEAGPWGIKISAAF